MLVVSIAFLALAPAVGATRPGTAFRTAQEDKIPQYHGTNTRQYHEIAASSGPISAWLRARGSSRSELANSIYPLVISPDFASSSPKRHKKSNASVSSQSDDWIGSQNSGSISSQIAAANERTSSDPRLMLQIGALLGLIYVAFLAVWFWATRFRLRPPRSAST